MLKRFTEHYAKPLASHGIRVARALSSVRL